MAYTCGWHSVNLLENAGDAIAPFKTRGALDLMIGTDSKADRNRRQPVVGDQRLLVTRVGEKASTESLTQETSV